MRLSVSDTQQKIVFLPAIQFHDILTILILFIYLLFFQRRDVYGAWEQYLGLEHSDNAPKRSYAANHPQNMDLTLKIIKEDAIFDS